MPVFLPATPAGPLAERITGRLARALLAAAGRLTSPLTPDDYLGLIDPLLSARHPAGRVTAVRPEGPGAVTLVIRPGRGWAGHRAGQYLPVGVELDGVRHWRTYSLTSPPEDGTRSRVLTVTVKEDPRGAVSPHLVHRTSPGTVLRLGPAQGEFVLPEPSPARMLMVTAGSGITPVMGMLRTLARRPPPARTDVLLLHSAPGPGDCLFRAELTGLARRAPWLRLHLHYTRSAGRLTAEHVGRLCPDWAARETWACGPAGLLDALRARWDAAGAARRLHVEHFRLLPLAPLAPAADGGGRVRFERSGVEAESAASVPLLHTGEAAGAVLPYGCRRGICFGCLAPLLHGRVRDLRTGEVHGEPGELIQTCVNGAAGPLALDL
ncbi:oxidoreductase [Streptomyces ruber]|uniref:Oxidoreductase n=2 Tax=Streptomyces TaxID=1883 RepID=A0A918ESJ3_9ACTN|nr:ferredoxin reductase [Streptomyces ruber]GGQ55033.1 oxidoreductase [Streptomyces ruber]